VTLVRQFHEAFDLPINDYPERVDREVAALRMRLITEEYREVEAEFERLLIHLQQGASIDAILAIYRDLLKELADLRYVVEGACVTLGLPIEAAFKEVHRSNMSKLGPGGEPLRREDGKVLKGPGYIQADMEKFVPAVIEGSCDE
jgi:predicted HAD superfamily Cof-like phosphohydrolase